MVLPFTLPSLPYKWIALALGVLSVLAIIFFSVKGYADARYEAGQLEERAIWQNAIAEQRQKVLEAQRAADALLNAQVDRDDEAISKNRKELEDAVSQIPDQDTSDRQRARACFELRRSGNAPPACFDGSGEPSGT